MNVLEDSAVKREDGVHLTSRIQLPSLNEFPKPHAHEASAWESQHVWIRKGMKWDGKAVSG